MKNEKVGILSSKCLRGLVCGTSLLFLSISLSSNAFAQKNKTEQNPIKKGDMVMGIVQDMDENPLQEIKVLESSVEDRVMTYSTTTSGGDFSIKVVNPKDSIKIKHKGYQEVSLPLDKKFYTITLMPLADSSAKDVAEAK